MSIALFGPEVTRWTQEGLADLQSSLRQRRNLHFLGEAVRQLSATWPVIESLFGGSFNGREKLQQLVAFGEGQASLDPEQLDNIHLAPLTVLSHIAEFVRHADSDDADHYALPDFRGAQGFCIGFLSAAAVAVSRERVEFERNAANALRLAVCIGAIIDAEDSGRKETDRLTAMSVRWKSDVDRAYFEATIDLYPEAYVSCLTDDKTVTVTLPIRDEASLRDRLARVKMATNSIGLKGSFHHAIHLDIARKLASICSTTPDLQLPPAQKLRLPLRSTANADLIRSGNLHDIAIDSILCRRAHWFQTVKATAADLGDEVKYLPLGKGSAVPRSLSVRKMSFASGAQRPILSAPAADISVFGDREEIAVIGMACRFPQADSIDEFWQLINAGGSAIGEVPALRFDPAEITREPKASKFFGNFLRNPDMFDHRFFGISGREAKSMDPQQCLALQVGYEALESSGYFRLPSEKQATDIGCYLGVGSVDYEDNVAGENANAFSALGTLRAFISGRISHHFGLSGPSVTVDTACSSSAVAIHTACKAVLSGECSMALAGGVNVITSPNLYQNLMKGSFLSPTGASKAFDASADGYCRGEGAGMVLLKRLSDAVTAGDLILGVIAGSAVNQGANCSPITVPESSSQSNLYKQAMLGSGLKPTDVTFVEAHGTGTPVGDPIEYESVRKTFSDPSRKSDIYLGSVKDNIGHAEGASGAAGLIKTLLMMQHKVIPKQANFKTLNPRIKSATEDRIIVPKESQKWNAKRSVALVNNYGAAGSNAALVIREYIDPHKRHAEKVLEYDTTSYPILLAAKSAENLAAYVKALAAFIPLAKASVRDIAYHISRRCNNSFEYRKAFMTSNLTELVASLEAASVRVPPVSWKYPVVLCFGGQTGNQVILSKLLYDNCRLFRYHLNKCDTECQAQGLRSLYPRLFQDGPVEDIVTLHCMLFSVQYASAKSWIDSGLEIDTLVGHSFGQITALCVAEALSLSDALRLVSGRARLMRDKWGPHPGSMLSIDSDRSFIENLVATAKEGGSKVDVACVNGPRSVVVAGETSAIESLASTCVSAGYKTRQLANSHAFHSQLTNSIIPDLKKLAESLDIRKPRYRIETCSTKTSWSEITADRIAEHTREPVYFAEAVDRIASRLPSASWLEVGSASPIIAMARRVLAARDNHDNCDNNLIPIDLGANPTQSLSDAVCQLWRTGSNAQHWHFHQSEKHNYDRVNIPPYQFEQWQHWIPYKPRVDADLILEQRAEDSAGPNLVNLVKKDGPKDTIFSVNALHPIFQYAARGHAVTGQPLCPASMYVELAARCAMEVCGTNSKSLPQVGDLNMFSPLGLSIGQRVFLRLSKKDDSTWEFTVYSQSPQGDAETEHADGYIKVNPVNDPFTAGRMQMLNRLARNSRCDQIMASPTAPGISGPMVYRIFGEVVEYADYYRGVTRICALENESAGNVCVPEIPLGLEMGTCDPISMDSFLQVAGIHVNCLSPRRDSEVFMCTAIEDIMFSEAFMENRDSTRSWSVYSRYEKIAKGHIVNHIFVFDKETKDLVLTVVGAVFRSVPFKSVARSLSKLNGGIAPVEAEPDSGYQSSSSSLAKEDDKEASEDVEPARSQSVDQVTDVWKDVRRMLSEVLEIPAEEITQDSSLEELGIDSLLITEVTEEIAQRFDVRLGQAELQSLTDAESLCRVLQPEGVADSRRGSKVDPVEKTSQAAARKPSVAPTPSTKSPQIEASNSDFGVASQNSFLKLRNTYDDEAKITKFDGFCTKVLPLQSDLVTQYVVEAFRSIGCDLAALKPGDEVPVIQYIEKHTRLIPQLYQILKSAGLIEGTWKSYRRTARAPPSEPSAELHQTMLDSFSQHDSETKLLHATGPKLAQCLTGTADPIGLIFKDATARALLEDVYTNAPMFKAGTQLLARYLSDVLDKFDGDREIRILELGAGTGGTTKFLVNKLSQSGKKFKYTFTDLSASLVGQAKRKFSKYSFMEYTTMDIEKDPAAKYVGAYDVILSTNCIHATHDLVLSTTNIRKMLRPDGILCLVELTRNLYWFDLVFGLLEGWWLFNDGREHVLAHESRWKRCLTEAGFNWIDWSDNASEESDVLRVITASAAKPIHAPPAIQQETVTFKEVDGLKLAADIHYPEQDMSGKKLPVALMIHGGGHVMLSRKDIRPEQTQMLLRNGFLPISVDYRLCPETTLTKGPMVDVVDALAWARNTLPGLALKRSDIQVDSEKVVCIGWSTGGTLALSLGWTAAARNIAPPNAILAFYCPTDYEDPFWRQPNIPAGSEDAALKHQLDDDFWAGVFDKPITAYNVDPSKRAVGGWMAASDSRSRIPLYMNWRGCTLNVLLRGLDKTARCEPEAPSPAEIAAISPLAHIGDGSYQTPTFLLHPRKDDLIPWQQAERTYHALQDAGVDAEFRLVENAIHLFDMYRGYEKNEKAKKAVKEGYQFLCRQVGVSFVE